MEHLADRLQAERERLTAFVAKNAGWLLRYESEEDLVQGSHLKALEAADSFEDRGDGAFFAWILTITRQHLATRANYWRALKREAGPALRRMSLSPDSVASVRAIDPTANVTGPLTFAMRRELLELAAQALETLPERDRALVALRTAGTSDVEIGARFDLSEASAQRAAHRATRKFERAFEFLVGTLELESQ